MSDIDPQSRPYVDCESDEVICGLFGCDAHLSIVWTTSFGLRYSAGHDVTKAFTPQDYDAAQWSIECANGHVLARPQEDPEEPFYLDAFLNDPMNMPSSPRHPYKPVGWPVTDCYDCGGDASDPNHAGMGVSTVHADANAVRARVHRAQEEAFSGAHTTGIGDPEAFWVLPRDTFRLLDPPSNIGAPSPLNVLLMKDEEVGDVLQALQVGVTLAASLSDAGRERIRQWCGILEERLSVLHGDQPEPEQSEPPPVPTTIGSPEGPESEPSGVFHQPPEEGEISVLDQIQRLIGGAPGYAEDTRQNNISLILGDDGVSGEKHLVWCARVLSQQGIIRDFRAEIRETPPSGGEDDFRAKLVMALQRRLECTCRREVIPDTNTGHGHVWSRPDELKVRCGGSTMCRECAMDEFALIQWYQDHSYGFQEMRAVFDQAAIDAADEKLNAEQRAEPSDLPYRPQYR